MVFCLVSFVLFIAQPLTTAVETAFGYLLFLLSVYTGRWIGTQASRANWLDMFRMFFLSFFTLSLGGLAVFGAYVQKNLPMMHYLESLINIACFSGLSVLFGFFAYRIMQKLSTKPVK